jgi:predicted ribosome quality control (RQC) complex YloA/Tae2 family protein
MIASVFMISKMKESMTSADIAAIVHELRKLIGARLDKAYQRGNEIRLKLYIPGEGNGDLIIDDKRIHMTKYAREAPKIATSFAMSFRKYLSGGRISGINQHDFDRIVEINVKRGEETCTLVVELFSKGNVILLNDDREIILPFKQMRFMSRSLKRGERYVLPPSLISPIEMRRDDLRTLLSSSDKDLVRTLASNMNMGGLYAEEVCIRSGIDKNKKDLGEEEIDLIHEDLIEIFEPVLSGELRPHIVMEDGIGIDVLPFELRRYDGYEKRYFESFNEALDEFFGSKVEDEEDEGSTPLKRRINQQRDDLDRFKMELEECIKKTDAIYSNYARVEQALRESSVRNFSITISGLEVEMDRRKSIHQNAQRYYDRAKSLKKKIKGVEEALEETKKMIEEVKTRDAKVKMDDLLPKRKIEWYEKFRWFESSDGFLVIGGRDANTNEKIVKKHMDEHDIFFHSQSQGPVVVVKTDGKEIPGSTLDEAAIFSTSYSSAWKRGFYGGECYYVDPSQVSKRAEPGEYIRKGGFIIRGKRSYIKTQIGLSIGVEGERVVCGPPSAIERMKYVVDIEPGEKDHDKISKIISKMMIEMADEKDKRMIKSIASPEEIIRLLPPGGSGIKGASNE